MSLEGEWFVVSIAGKAYHMDDSRPPEFNGDRLTLWFIGPQTIQTLIGKAKALMDIENNPGFVRINSQWREITPVTILELNRVGLKGWTEYIWKMQIRIGVVIGVTNDIITPGKQVSFDNTKELAVKVIYVSKA